MAPWTTEDIPDLANHTAVVTVELTRFPAHPIVSQGSQEGVPVGSPLEVSGRVPA